MTGIDLRQMHIDLACNADHHRSLIRRNTTVAECLQLAQRVKDDKLTTYQETR